MKSLMKSIVSLMKGILEEMPASTFTNISKF